MENDTLREISTGNVLKKSTYRGEYRFAKHHGEGMGKIGLRKRQNNRYYQWQFKGDFENHEI